MIAAPVVLSPPEQLLWFHGCRRPEHIDLEGIASDRGARVVYRRLDGCAARLLTDGEQAVISIQASDTEGRRRFSLAHELAHWINDPRRGSSCFGADIGPQNAEAASVEAAANAFSGQLILPDYMVAPWMRGRRMNLALAVELAATFRTSVTAAAIELAKRAASGVCLVCHSRQGRRWFVRSRAWPAGLYPRMRLHPDTAAFDLVLKRSGSMSDSRTSPSIHWLSGAGAPAMPVEAQSMHLPDGTVLTMLVLATVAWAWARTPRKPAGGALGAQRTSPSLPGAPRACEPPRR
jgi:hypothetical protein